MNLKSYVSKTKPKLRVAKCHVWPTNILGRVEGEVVLLATYCLMMKEFDNISYGLKEEKKTSLWTVFTGKESKEKSPVTNVNLC